MEMGRGEKMGRRDKVESCGDKMSCRGKMR